MRPRHASPTLAAAISALLATAACTSAPPSAAPLSQKQLTARLLTATSAPTGFTIDPIDTDPPSDNPSPTAGQPGCQALAAAGDLTQFAQAPATHAFEIINGTAAHGLRWLGNEQLFSYADNNAAHILDQLRTLAKQCPNGASIDPPVHVTIADGAHLGDDSLLLKIRTTQSPQLAEDAIFIRTGTTIIVISENFTSADTTPSPVEQLAAPALNAFTTPSKSTP